VEGLIVIKKPKESIFDEINMEQMSVGALENSVGVNPSVDTLESKKAQYVTLSNYGTQDIKVEEQEEEKDYEAILFGTALHYTLEMLGSFDEVGLCSAMIALQNRYGQQLTVDSIRQIEQRVKNLIEYEAFQQILDGAKISKEQSLSFEGELKQIDLLLEYDEHCLVVDYKSSKKYALKHQNQVRYYQKAITNLTGKRTEGLIVYLLEEGIEAVNLN
jgi:exodeoxyribonuclease V beta subunit